MISPGRAIAIISANPSNFHQAESFMRAYPISAHGAIYGGQTRTLDAAGIAHGKGPVRRKAASAQMAIFTPKRTLKWLGCRQKA
jgi:hypothetical protein